jgi:pimeloyl-ACP methyl ester carboxylesterase
MENNKSVINEQKNSKKKMNKGLKVTLITFSVFVIIFSLLFLVVFPLATRPRTELTPLAQDWQDSGQYIKWNSTLDENSAYEELDIFTIQQGNPTNPAILMIHGYPTNCFDFKDLFDQLSNDYYVCALDTPGYGLSDKPKRGYTYSIIDDAHLIQHYIIDVLGLSNVTILTHDKGDSVGLALLTLYQSQNNYTINHHIITNGNIYLPLADLTPSQKLLLNRFTGPFLSSYINGDLLANGLNRDFHIIPESQEIVDAMASIIDYQDGGEVQHDIIKYLNQRAEFEDTWLQDLFDSDIPTTIIWGLNDTVAPTRVADFVWEEFLENRVTPANYWQMPNAHHYLQNDRPEILSDLIRQIMGETISFNSYAENLRPIQAGTNP